MSTHAVGSPSGSYLGRYEILTRLAVGGMAEIFLACDAAATRRRRLVTLKRILPELREQDEFVRMFVDEARITTALSHPNIAAIYELDQSTVAPFIAMEFIAGESLSSILRACTRAKRPLPLGFAARIGIDLCKALHHAHQLVLPNGEPGQVIHRDVSPRNVMVSYEGVVKVIDFGVAKAKGSLSRTASGNIKGSHGYMSPEQARGAPVDPRSDIFSAGVVMHELLTGKPLFRRSSELLTFRGILRDEIPPPIALNPGVPRSLSDAVMTALARPPAQRFSSAAEMAIALERTVPALLFDAARSSALMDELFGERIRQTRELQELAGTDADSSVLARSAERLRDPLWETQRLAPDAPVDPGRTSVFGQLSTGVIKLSEVVTRTSVAPVREEPTVEGAIVLSVDDSEISRQFIEAHLESSGFPVLSCASAAETLALLERQLPDLLLLDVRMPGVNGFELCRSIRAATVRRPFLPILFVSSASSFAERLEGLAAGGDDFIRKPYAPEELVGLVRAHLQRAALLQRLHRPR